MTKNIRDYLKKKLEISKLDLILVRVHRPSRPQNPGFYRRCVKIREIWVVRITDESSGNCVEAARTVFGLFRIQIWTVLLQYSKSKNYAHRHFDRFSENQTIFHNIFYDGKPVSRDRENQNEIKMKSGSE